MPGVQHFAGCTSGEDVLKLAESLRDRPVANSGAAGTDGEHLVGYLLQDLAATYQLSRGFTLAIRIDRV